MILPDMIPVVRRVQPTPLNVSVHQLVYDMPDDSPMEVMSGPLKGLVWVKQSPHVGYIVGDYEPNVQQVMKRAVKPGDVVYDLGAHHGFHTFLAVTLSRGMVHAFEIRSDNLDVLRKNVWNNSLEEYVKVVPLGVSDTVGTAKAYYARDTMWGRLAGVDGRPDWEEEPCIAATVTTTTLDRYIYSDNNPVPDVLKIDVEGAESHVLFGGERVLGEHHPSLVISIHGENQLQVCRETLLKFGYSDGQIEEVTKGDILLVSRC